MAASPNAGDGQDNWGPSDDTAMGRRSDEPSNGEPLPVDDRGQDPNDAVDYPRGSSVGPVSVSKVDNYREKQVKPNKVYIGGLPEHTRAEDLQNCFGQIGNIVNIELKVGYGFVEFDNRMAAEESVAKYHEGHFMGNKIRVELSHGGGRTAKYSSDPGACFKCGNMGHWARECPNAAAGLPQRRNYDDRRDYGAAREMPPPRDSRYDYGPPRDSRDYRKAPSPPRDYRDYPPPPVSRGREYDDVRRGPPPSERDRYAAPPPPDYRGGRYPPPPDPYRNYAGPPPPPPVQYDRYDRRPHERYPDYPPPPSGRGRSPPRGRDDFSRAPPPRDYTDYRGRPPSPPAARYDYGRGGAPDPGAQRYRRRSESPPPRSSGGGYEQGYNTGGNAGGFSGNGYSGAPPRSRDYLPPPPRNGRDAPADNYRRP